jgi:6-pyruvoyltetrahydropterin/6-carboxytetrahydropterin synthase
MFTIGKRFAFEAAHHLPQMPEGHQCRRKHGHSYVIEVELQADQIDPATGFVRDYGELRPIRDYIDGILDHQDLAELFGGENTTAERLAVIFYYLWRSFVPELSAVTVRETAKTFSTYRPGVQLTTENLAAALRANGMNAMQAVEHLHAQARPAAITLPSSPD